MIKLNIRQKIILGIAIFSICFSGIGFLSYSNIDELEREMLIVERADDLSNLILELRRVEKNYFLYRDPALFTQGIKYIDQADALLFSLKSEIRVDIVKPHGIALQDDLKQYRERLGSLVADQAAETTSKERDAARELREVGQALVEHSRAISRFERASILSINRKLRTALVLSIAAIATVVMTLVVFVTSSILRPLRRVQEATKRIATGTFVPLPIKNAHDEIQQVFVALNSMVEQLEKRQLQLVQAQKLSSIGTLASGIAHQLNNPLNNISTSCQILMENESGKNEFADRMMRNIEQETLRSRDIVKGLLEFSREREYSSSVCPLESVVQSAVRLVSSQLPSNISIKVDVPKSIQLQVDRQRIQEAFINLILNAVQAIEPQDGVISLSAQEEGESVLIMVQDNGAGMDKETLDRIFDPFYSTKEVGQGTGLGLYIVYGIIEKHHGAIRVESTPGMGSTFYIRLPLTGEVQA